ncbi:MAG: PCRF domain-containing protein, partial [Lachnospiraceae bacterium]|nr:PCRF domain-containing protein [Lachnospiraceae bacterium]
MFDRLEDLLRTYEELMEELNDPALAQDQTRYRRLMKEQAELQPIVEVYKKYKDMNRDLSDASEMLETEKDEEMRKLLKDEIWQLKNDLPEVEEQLKILLLPRDPNDEKNVVLEIRSGAGGEEAALFAAEVYRMYYHYAETQGWKTETLEYNESGIGGASKVTCLITGHGAYSKLKYESGVHRVQ